MNLYPSIESREVCLLSHHLSWTMVVGRERSAGKPHYFAQVMRRRQGVCRLALAGTDLSEDEARKALAEEARAWIADYPSRPLACNAILDAPTEDSRAELE
jgi:hypothetical protein